MVKKAVFAVLFLSLAWTTAPRLLALARDTTRLSRMTLEQRRVEELGTLYRSIEVLDARVPANEPVAVILHRKADADLAIYVNYFRYPRPTRIYFGLDAYRRDPRAPRVTAMIDRDVAWEVRLR